MSDAGEADEAATPSDVERFNRVVSSWDAHGDSNTSRASDGIAYSVHLRSLGLSDEAAHLLRESAQNGQDDDDALGWLGLSGA